MIESIEDNLTEQHVSNCLRRLSTMCPKPRDAMMAAFYAGMIYERKNG